MLKEIRRIKSATRRRYIYILQYRKIIGSYINERGFKCYDTNELKQYASTKPHKGRPNKIENKGE